MVAGGRLASSNLGRETIALERILICPDTHSPYEDKRAWKLMMRVARRFKPHTVVHIGDLADAYTISSHSKDPERKHQWEYERREVRKLRAQLDSLGAKRKVFLEGNHEDRLRRYLQDRAPELASIINMDDQLQLSENGWEFIPYRSHAKIGKLFFSHDVGGGGKHTTARALDAFQHSVVIGHHHAMQYSVEGDATGKYRVGAQFGWLGDVRKIDYMNRVKALRAWSLGFGIGHHDTQTGMVYLVPVPIVSYTCCVEGKVYRG